MIGLFTTKSFLIVGMTSLLLLALTVVAGCESASSLQQQHSPSKSATSRPSSDSYDAAKPPPLVNAADPVDSIHASSATHDEATLLAAVKPLPHGRHGHRVERLGDTLIVLGGFSDHPRHRGPDQTWIFEQGPGGWEWRRGPDLDRGRAFAGSANLGGKIVAIGESWAVLDPTRESWLPCSSTLPFPKSHFAGVSWRDEYYCLGGFPKEHFEFVAHSLDRGSRTLPQPPGLVPGSHLHIVHPLEDGLHVIGGFNDDLSDQHWVFDGSSWKAAAPTPAPTFAKFAVTAAVNYQIFIFSTELQHKFDVATSKWTRLSTPPVTLAMPGVVVLDKHIVVIGGEPLRSSDAEPTVWIYDTTTDHWTSRR